MAKKRRADADAHAAADPPHELPTPAERDGDEPDGGEPTIQQKKEGRLVDGTTDGTPDMGRLVDETTDVTPALSASERLQVRLMSKAVELSTGGTHRDKRGRRNAFSCDSQQLVDGALAAALETHAVGVSRSNRHSTGDSV